MRTAEQCGRSSRGVTGVLSVLMLACGACSGSEADSPRNDQSGVETWGTSDMEFRRIARVQPRPEYPVVSLDSGKTGVTVAAVVTTPEGRMERVDVLEAPDAHVGDAVSRALGQWEIEPPVDDGQPVRVRSKLFFYFVMENGEGLVRSPEEMLRESESLAPAAGRSVGSTGQHRIGKLRQGASRSPVTSQSPAYGARRTRR